MILSLRMFKVYFHCNAYNQVNQKSHLKLYFIGELTTFDTFPFTDHIMFRNRSVHCKIVYSF